MLDLYNAAHGERESAVVAAIAYVTGGNSELTQLGKYHFITERDVVFSTLVLNLVLFGVI
jgi:hypothetical protein